MSKLDDLKLPTPDYRSDDGAVYLYRADCMDILPQLPDGAVDVVVTDPPYGMSYKSGWSGRSIKGDGDTNIRDAALSAWSGPAIVFGRWDCPRPPKTRARLIWNKGDWPGMGDLSFPWGPSDEEIYIIGDGFTGKRSGTVIHENRLTGNTRHPNEKPVGLLSKLIRKSPAGCVADPFMGSGTTGVACVKLGRSFIGIEREPRYFDIAVKRIDEAFADQALFAGVK